MLNSINNNTIPRFNNFRNEVDPYGVSVYMKRNNTLQRTTQTNVADTDDKQSKKFSTDAKAGIALGTAATALGAVYGVKKIQVKNIKNIQKAFQETFMRDDITVEQARAMKQRYLEIEKIKDDKEYAKALFEEAKKNYGLEKSDIKLVFKDLTDSGGYCYSDNSLISITSNCSRSHMLNTIHHEFRHAKQHNAIANLRIEKEAKIKTLMKNYIDEIIEKTSDEDLKNLESKINDKESKKEFYKELRNRATKELKEKGINLDDSKIKERYEYFKNKLKIPHMVKESIPEKYQDWADKCKDALEHYVDGNKNIQKYYRNYMEVDARKAGRTIDKFVNGKAFGNISDKIDDFLCSTGLAKIFMD